MESNIRWNWLKGMYIYALVGAGGFGLGILLIPDIMSSIFGWPKQDHITFGISGSVFLAVALLSILGLRSPLKFVPLLLFGLIYKTVWFLCVMIPMLVAGTFPVYGYLFAVIFASYIVGYLIAIPFNYVFAAKQELRTTA